MEALVIDGDNTDSEVEVTVWVDVGTRSVDQSLVVFLDLDLDLDLLEDEEIEDATFEVTVGVVLGVTDAVTEAESGEVVALLATVVEIVENVEVTRGTAAFVELVTVVEIGRFVKVASIVVWVAVGSTEVVNSDVLGISISFELGVSETVVGSGTPRISVTALVISPPTRTVVGNINGSTTELIISAGAPTLRTIVGSGFRITSTALVISAPTPTGTPGSAAVTTAPLGGGSTA